MSAICSRSSSSPRVNGCWMCPRRSRRGCGCWGRAVRTRTTRTTATRSRSRRCTRRTSRAVAPADHAAVLRLLAKRNKELGSARTRTVCRLHALLVELVPGGISQANHGQSRRGAAGERDAGRSGGSDPPRAGPRASRGPAPHRRADARLEAAPRRRGRGLAHVGAPTCSASVRSAPRSPIGQTRDVSRFAEPRPLRRLQRHRSHRGRLPVATTCIGCRGAGTANSTTRSTWPRSPRSATRTHPAARYYDRKLAEGKTKKEALRALKRRISDALYQRLVADAAAKTGPGGQAGTTSTSQRDRPHTPTAGSSEQPLPDPRRA